MEIIYPSAIGPKELRSSNHAVARVYCLVLEPPYKVLLDECRTLGSEWAYPHAKCENVSVRLVTRRTVERWILTRDQSRRANCGLVT